MNTLVFWALIAPLMLCLVGVLRELFKNLRGHPHHTEPSTTDEVLTQLVFEFPGLLDSRLVVEPLSPRDEPGSDIARLIEATHDEFDPPLGFAW